VLKLVNDKRGGTLNGTQLLFLLVLILCYCTETNCVRAWCSEIASSTPPAEPSAQQFAKRPPEGEKLIKPAAQVAFLTVLLFI